MIQYFKGKLSGLSAEIFLSPIQGKDGINLLSEKLAGPIDTENINHVITTSPPHSTQLIGLKLKKKYPGIKWVADLRDPWTDIYYYGCFIIPDARREILNMRRMSCKRQTKIITVGKSLKKSFAPGSPVLKEVRNNNKWL